MHAADYTATCKRNEIPQGVQAFQEVLLFQNIPCLLSPRSKEGTLPFVEFEGVEYPDSSFIIRFVQEFQRVISFKRYFSRFYQTLCLQRIYLVEGFIGPTVVIWQNFC